MSIRPELAMKDVSDISDAGQPRNQALFSPLPAPYLNAFTGIILRVPWY
jgi:hypothetical protein